MKNILRIILTRLGVFARRIPQLKDMWCDLDAINRLIQVNISTAILHQQTFPRFKGIYAGRDIAVIATGPTLSRYKPIENCITIGVNHAFLNPELELDYLFAYDYTAIKGVIKEMNEYRRGKCIKFYGFCTEYKDSINRVIPESEAIKANALRFRTDWAPVDYFHSRFYVDLSVMPVAAYHSSVFAAMQFALWTNPRRIYIVGCDCSADGHFTDVKRKEIDPPDAPIRLIDGWKALKFFANRYYPDTEVVSVHPVGLKGVFTDIYQK